MRARFTNRSDYLTLRALSIGDRKEDGLAQDRKCETKVAPRTWVLKGQLAHERTTSCNVEKGHRVGSRLNRVTKWEQESRERPMGTWPLSRGGLAG